MKYKKPILITAAILALAVASAVGGYAYYTGQKALTVQPEETVETTEETQDTTEAAEPETKESKKEEMVYVQANASGTAKDIIVSDILRNGTGAATITDRSDLNKIKNVKGKESYTKNSDGTITWQADGNDIYYQGTTDKELPVEVKITYYLEGEEIAPEKLAGKAGNVKIRFDYINHETQTVNVDGEDRTISTPFAAVTGIILDEDKFMNVEMENGRVISDGSRIMAGGIAIPGLSDSIALSEIEDMDDLDIPEYLELTAYTTDFAVSMTMTAITSDLTEEIDMDDLDSYDDLKDDMQELLDASKELVDGTNDLVDGVEELKDGSDDLYDGAVELDDGAKDLKDGATELDDGAYDLQDGALELKNALKEYNAGMDTLVAAMKDADGNGTDLATVANQLAAGVSQTVDSVLANTLATINEKVAPYKKYGVPQFSSIDEFLEFDPSPLAGAIEKLVYAGEMSQDQAAAISAVVADLPAQKEEVKATQTQLLYLKDSMNQFAAGIGTIYTATTTQLQPGAAKILDGSRELYAGTKDLKEGTEELLDGTVELKDGTAELLDGTVDLKDGVQELYDGSIELRDGMEEFDEDGIQKLYDMIYTDMQKVIDRARAVTDAGKAYQSFTQIAPGMNGSVKFLIETEAIE